MKMKTKKKEAPLTELLNLDIGCGETPREGFKGIDISSDVKPDYCLDIRKTPWPFKNESVSEVHCSHFLEHLDGMERISFFNELYRVMKTGATALFITPAPFTHRYMQDPTHKFPMVVQEFYNYLSKNARDGMRLTHYPLTCNFEWSGFFHENPEATAGRNDEYKQFAGRHYINSLLDLQVTLKKI